MHTEDQFWVNGVTDRDGKAFKSVALACSSDYGRSWDNARRILTLGDKPAVASWSGTGDQVQDIPYIVSKEIVIFFFTFLPSIQYLAKEVPKSEAKKENLL